jgi:predicted DNA-binding transcriptional regulator AlpA
MSRPVAQNLENLDRLLSVKAVCQLTSWSRTSIGRLVYAGEFPKPVRLGRHRIAFRESEIADYLQSRAPKLGAPYPTQNGSATASRGARSASRDG